MPSKCAEKPHKQVVFSTSLGITNYSALSAWLHESSVHGSRRRHSAARPVLPSLHYPPHFAPHGCGPYCSHHPALTLRTSSRSSAAAAPSIGQHPRRFPFVPFVESGPPDALGGADFATPHAPGVPYAPCARLSGKCLAQTAPEDATVLLERVYADRHPHGSLGIPAFRTGRMPIGIRWK